MRDWPAFDSRNYIVAFELRSIDDCPPDFELPSSVAGFETGLFLSRGDRDWFGRPSYPPHVLLLKDGALHIFSHPSTGEPPRRGALDQIASVESGHMLLKGWLRFAGAGFDHTVRYNTRGFRSVFRFMRRFRDELLRDGLPLASSPVPFANALALELDSGESVLMRDFQQPSKVISRKLVASAPPLDRWRFAGSHQQAAVVDYRPGKGILLAIREHRFVCPLRRCSEHRSDIRSKRTHSAGEPERRIRAAGSYRARQSFGLPANRGRFRSGDRDSKEAQ